MPGVFRWPVSKVTDRARAAKRLGVGSLILFGIPAEKDGEGSGAFASDGVVQQAIRRVKDAEPDMVVIADTCVDEYTDHGHCGILDRRRR